MTINLSNFYNISLSSIQSTQPTVHTPHVREAILESGAQTLNNKSNCQNTGMVVKIVTHVEELSPSCGAPVVNTAHQARSTTLARIVTHAPLKSITPGQVKIHAGVVINTSTSNSDAMASIRRYRYLESPPCFCFTFI